MKKITFLILTLALMTFGCTHSYNSMPVGAVGVDMKGGANCEILGDTEASATCKTVLFFFNLGDGKKTGNFPGSIVPFAGKKMICEQAAAYKAIQNFEGADQILSPRYKTEMVFSIPGIYEEYISTVKAKAVKIK
jgi:hypothetical protein